MKTYAELTTTQQAKAVKMCLSNLLEAVCEGAIRFKDKLNGDNLQARIDEAGRKAESMQTPWFVGEYVLDTCRDDLTGMAQCDAEDAIYAEPGEYVVRGIL